MRNQNVISVMYGGAEVTDARAREQLSTFVWAALRKQKYVEGSRCEVMVALADGMYDIKARAREPETEWLPLLELALPANGIETSEFERFLREQNLTDFVSPAPDRVMLGGNPHNSLPDTVVVSGKPTLGRNDPCACGSGKKFKKCCLQ